jgi:DNA-binding CsgD family transcriptional regulator
MTESEHRERALVGLIQAAGEATTLDDVRERADPLLRRVLEARLAAVVEFDEQGRPHGRIGDVAELTPEIYFPTFADTDPMARAMEQSNQPIMLLSRHIDRSAFAASGVYNEYYRPRQIGRILCARMLAPAYYARDHEGTLRATPGLVLMAFFRAASQPEFTPTDVRRVARILPALQALALRTRRAATVDALLERTHPQPRLALDRYGAVLWASRRAVQLLDRHLGGRRQLPDALIDAARKLLASPADSDAANTSSFSVPLVTPTGVRLRAELHVERTASAERFVVADLLELDDQRPVALATRCGLTRSESAVLDALGLGLSNEEIAQRLFVSVPTVKTHVHRILAKLGVSSRLQAALLLARG